jgi:Sulfate permease family
MATTTSEQGIGQRIASVVPALTWIRTYDRSNWLRPDVLAGVTVAAFSIPESMAYAGLAGLSPENGLYASMLALLVYVFFGTSRHMSVGTTSALAIMVPFSPELLPVLCVVLLPAWLMLMGQTRNAHRDETRGIRMANFGMLVETKKT